jgi:hypothetical protein
MGAALRSEERKNMTIAEATDFFEVRPDLERAVMLRSVVMVPLVLEDGHDTPAAIYHISLRQYLDHAWWRDRVNRGYVLREYVWRVSEDAPYPWEVS